MFTKCQGSGGYTSGTRGGWLMPFSGVSVCFQNQLTASVQCRFSWSSIEVVRLRSELLETWRLLAAHTTTLNRDIYNRHCAINCVCVCVCKQHLETTPSPGSRPTGHQAGRTARSTNQTTAGQPFLRFCRMNVGTSRDSGGRPAPWRRAEADS